MTNPMLETINPAETAEFQRLAETYKTGIALVPQPYGSEVTTSLHSDGGDFAKWLRATNKDVDIHVPAEPHPRVLLRNKDVWLPLFWLGTNVVLPMFLGFLVNYLYDRAKGSLKGGKVTAHVEAVYRDRKTGVYKKFKFDGDAEQLKAAMKKFDPNEFMNGDEK